MTLIKRAPTYLKTIKTRELKRLTTVLDEYMCEFNIEKRKTTYIGSGGFENEYDVSVPGTYRKTFTKQQLGDLLASQISVLSNYGNILRRKYPGKEANEF